MNVTGRGKIMKKALKITENILYTFMVCCSVVLLIYYSINIAHWNGTHNGLGESLEIIFGFLTMYFPTRAIFDKFVRKNKFFVIAAIICSLIFVLMIILSFLLRCPYCNSWSLAPM